MNQLLHNPESFSETFHISENSFYGVLLTKSMKETKKEIVFDVDENCSLDLTFVDFMPSDILLSLNVNLKRNASVRINLASVNFEKFNKIYHANVNHLDCDTYSLTHMAGINAGKGKLEFWGNSLIVNGAHRSDTRQEGKITNLDIDAKSKVSPALLIKENDVKASHGASVGAYNENELFYLMSRGLTLQQSKKLITDGSLIPILESFGDETFVSLAKKEMETLVL